MPYTTQTNPLFIDVAQGDVGTSDKSVIQVASDPAGNANTITGMTTANPTVITTTTAHGFITGKQVNINTGTAFVATGTVPNGNYTATVLSATTFSIPFNYTGTYTSGGAVYQLFQKGQVVAWQTWNGTASGAASAPAYPTAALVPLTTNFAILGIIEGPNNSGNGINGQGVPLGASMQVVTSGQTTALVSVTTVALTQSLQASATIPGCSFTTAAGVAGKDIGVALQAVTVTSNYLPLSCQVFVRLS